MTSRRSSIASLFACLSLACAWLAIAGSPGTIPETAGASGLRQVIESAPARLPSALPDANTVDPVLQVQAPPLQIPEEPGLAPAESEPDSAACADVPAFHAGIARTGACRPAPDAPLRRVRARSSRGPPRLA